MKFVTSFLNATVGLDTTALQQLGFELEPSPHLEGVQLVVNDLPPTNSQWFAVAFMIVALLLTCAVEGGGIITRQQQNRRHPQYWIWTLGLMASCLHNVDNILRPGTYFTPSWIVRPHLLGFAMDYGFIFWLIVMMLGIVSLHTPYKLPIILHSAGTSFGILRYNAQAPSRFSLVAHASILFEVIMGVIVGIKLLGFQQDDEDEDGEVSDKQTGSASSSAAYSQIPTVEGSSGLEMPSRNTVGAESGLRQRSRSPKVTVK